MIYTSYYANWRKFPKEYKTIAISRYIQSWIKVDIHLEELAPSAEILNLFKNNKISEKQFDKLYLEELNKIDIRKIIDKIDNSILLCYEKNHEDCHRMILANWLKEQNIKIEELV